MFDLIAVAHRGYSASYPENTLLAYEAAIQAGAQVVETDARLTADGEVISCHDPDLRRLAGIPQGVHEVKAETIRAFDLGRGEPPAFVHEVIKKARGRAEVLVDIKIPSPELADAIMEITADAGQGVTIYAGVRDIEQAAYLQSRTSKLRYVALLADYDAIPQWLSQGVDAVRAWEEDLDHPQVQALLLSGETVWVTAGRRRQGETTGHITLARLEALQKAGVSVVLLNDPSLITGRSVEL